MKENQNKYIEINYDGKLYRSLGRTVDDAYEYWPFVGDFEDFLKDDLSEKITMFGVLLYIDSSHLDEFPWFKTIKDKYPLYTEIIHKWYHKGLEGISGKVFIDFVWGIQGSPIEVEGESIPGENGTIYFDNNLTLTLQKYCKDWDDISDQFFVPVEFYEELLKDIKTLEKIFEKHVLDENLIENEEYDS
jgi:hypothetical protein